jgi:dihydrofolate reductase
MELIVAHSKNNIIGQNNKVPWDVPEDLKFFLNTTKNHIVLMGRKTFDSLPFGPLKNRLNIVITNTIPNNVIHENVIYVNMETVFNIVEKQQQIKQRKVFIIGGTEIYKLFFDHCSILHITVINLDVEGDTLFPFDMEKLESENVFKNTYKSEMLQSRNNKTEYQIFTYERC